MDLVKIIGDRFDLNIPITKVNASTGEFEGWATVEQLDSSNEIIDLKKSWPFFVAHSKRFSDATENLSFGNVREQHDSKKAAGKLTAPPELRKHDSGADGIYIKGVVTDPISKQKLIDRVLIGISIGGKYEDKQPADDVRKGAVRFVANPSEYTLCDSPCVKDAMITVVKADGQAETAKAIGFTPEQYWSCRSGLEHGHVTKNDAKHCDGSTPLAKTADRETLEKCLYCVARIIDVLSTAQYVDGYHTNGDDPNFDSADAAIDSVVDDLYAALILYVNALQAEHADDGGSSSVRPMNPFTMTDLAESLQKDSPALTQLMKSLHVQLSNGSKPSKEEVEMTPQEIQKVAETHFRTMLAPVAKAWNLGDKDDIFAEIAKRFEQKGGTIAPVVAAAAVEKTDDSPLVKSIGDLTKAVTGMREDLTKDRARVDSMEKGIDLLGATFAKTLAFITDVKVEDDTDLEQVVKAIHTKPAPPKAVVRSIKKSDDTANEAAAAVAAATKPKTGNPLVDDAVLIASI